ncbi:hypothetical protein [Klebsiella aerogenes]|uniref:hypothetical protein n=1 Tax=Klebsiella aerogenes TaxID=548 RepID=UPI0022787807|nr:hypothetical protein [Klebsiella aerogenes]MCY4762697.1 hypothetical protein [Klebsiella aerogenes]
MNKIVVSLFSASLATLVLTSGYQVAQDRYQCLAVITEGKNKRIQPVRVKDSGLWFEHNTNGYWDNSGILKTEILNEQKLRLSGDRQQGYLAGYVKGERVYIISDKTHEQTIQIGKCK